MAIENTPQEETLRARGRPEGQARRLDGGREGRAVVEPALSLARSRQETAEET